MSEKLLKGGERLNIEKLESCPEKNPNLLVKVTEMGNIIEIQYMSKRNNKQTVQMLPGMKQYIVMDTGEIKDIEHHDTRADQKKSLYRTFSTLRGIINANVTDVNNVRWITLTYAENMTNSKKLYDDFKKFNMKFQYYIKKKGYNKAEYIVIMEPQGRGAWHCHLLYIFDTLAPFIENSILADIWSHGFVTIKKLDNVDNVGAYLTAYLGDMDMEELPLDDVIGNELKEVKIEENGARKSKYYVKGARLKLYPAGFRMFRCSRGVKKPIVTMETQKNAEKKASEGSLTYEKNIRLSDGDFECIINTRYYNKLR